jgi:hypothetical protein
MPVSVLPRRRTLRCRRLRVLLQVLVLVLVQRQQALIRAALQAAQHPQLLPDCRRAPPGCTPPAAAPATALAAFAAAAA